MSDNHASILFPNEGDNAPQQAPDWYKAQHSAAEARLTGRHDDQAARMFPSEAVKPEAPASRSNDDKAPEAVLFAKDAAHFDDSTATAFFNTFAMSATQDGDPDRADALRHAGAALVADFKSAGGNAADLSEALDIVRERQGDTLGGPVSEERLVEDFQTTMSGLMVAGVSMSDIDAARAFIRDLEMVSPGTMASLEQTGAGNDRRLISKAIKEARRRGY